jgi:hypothetical protein
MDREGKESDSRKRALVEREEEKERDERITLK